MLENSNLQTVVQTNCHISDARFASDYTLCTYLLKMREFYRWERSLEFGEALPGDAIGNWLSEREEYWENLEGAEFSPIENNGHSFDPFAADEINAELLPTGLIYSAGYGNKSKPTFFLAEHEKTIEKNGFRVYLAGRELARDLTASPAMTLGKNIFIRRESLRRMLWEKLEEWRWNKPDNAMGRVVKHYDFDNDLINSLEAMTDNEIEMMALHEIGEIHAGEKLGESWREMLQGFTHLRIELMARAVRDHLADALSTLPSLLEKMHSPSLHFYFANLSGLRKALYPALFDAYNHWVLSNDSSELKAQASAGQQHWSALAEQMLELHRKQKNTVDMEIESLIEQNHL